MIAALDVAYGEALAASACVLFEHWQDEDAAAEHTSLLAIPGEYVPGRFFERELPCLIEALEALAGAPDVIVVDGYVWLAGPARPGLGALLFEALERRIPVIGVAKNPFAGADDAARLLRGGSTRPLYVSAVGLELGEARDAIASMHGRHRIPTLLRHVDQLARQRLGEKK